MFFRHDLAAHLNHYISSFSSLLLPKHIWKLNSAFSVQNLHLPLQFYFTRLFSTRVNCQETRQFSITLTYPSTRPYAQNDTITMRHSTYLRPPLTTHLNTGGRAHRIHDCTRPQMLVAKFDSEKNRFFPDVTHSIHAVFPRMHSVCTTKLILKRSSCLTVFDFFSGVFPMEQQTLEGEGLLIIEALGSHSDTPHSVRSGRVISPT